MPLADKEYTPELIESCEDVEKVLKKVNPDYAPYKRMCRYLLKKETCNELIGKNETGCSQHCYVLFSATSISLLA